MIFCIRKLWSRSQTSSAEKITHTSPENILFVTAKPDFFDVGTAITSRVLQKRTVNDALLVSTIMESTRQSLIAKGFPVDRLIAPQVLKPILPRSETAQQKKQQHSHERVDQDEQSSTSLNEIDDNLQSESSTLHSDNVSKKTPKIGSWSRLSRISESLKSAHSSSHSNYINNDTEIKRLLSGCQSNSDTRIQSERKTTMVPIFHEDCTPHTNLINVKDLRFCGLAFFCHPDQIDEAHSESVKHAATDLARMLIALGSQVFSLSPHVLHLYWHSKQSVVAFNRNGALHFNVAHHAKKMPYDGSIRTLILYWLGVMIHEIAHNGCKPHNVVFEQVTRSLWQNCMMDASRFIKHAEKDTEKK